MSLAKKIAAHCEPGTGYYAVTDRGDCFHVRIYGNGKGGSGVTGLWHLLTDEEVAAIGREFNYELKAHRFQPGGFIVAKTAAPTCYAVAVATLRYLGIEATPRYL